MPGALLSPCASACLCLSECLHVSPPFCAHDECLHVCVSFGRLSPPPRPVPCVGNWTWDTAPRAGSRVGCWVFLACKHVCHFGGQGLWSQPQPTHDLAARRVLLPRGRGLLRSPAWGVSLLQHVGRKGSRPEVGSGWRLGGRIEDSWGRRNGGVGGVGVGRGTPHPIIKRLIKSPCSWKWLWEMTVNLETKRPASGRWGRGSEREWAGGGRTGARERGFSAAARGLEKGGQLGPRVAGLTPGWLQRWCRPW